MAGMLPGVKAARRRRIHQKVAGAGGWSELSSGGSVGFTRRPVFCLFASSFEPNHISAMSTLERNGINRRCQDEMLGKLAREAKERLDERLRLRAQKMTLVKSDVSEERVTTMARELKTEVFGSNKKKLKLLRWATRFGGKKSREEEEEEEGCAVCLEHYKVGETLVSLQCAHRFHSSCLLPWLQAHALCPCCRTTILP